MHRAAIGAATISASIAAVGTASAASPGAEPEAAPPPIVDDVDIEIATTALAMFVIDSTDVPGVPGEEAPCPIIARERVAELLGGQGITPRPDGYAVGVDGDDLMAPVVYCGTEASLVTESPDPAGGYGYEIQASYIDDPALFAQWTGELGATVVPADPALGGEYASQCGSGEGVEMCFAAWHRNGLVIRQYLGGPQTGTLQAQSDAIMLAAVPEAVSGLAAYAGVELAAPEGTLPPVEVPQVVTVPVTGGPNTTAPAVPATAAPASRIALTHFGVDILTGRASDVCPIVPQERVNELAVAAGLAPRSADYFVGTYADGRTGAATAVCGIRPDAALATPDPAAPHVIRIEASYLDGSGGFTDLLDGLGMTVTTADVPSTGGEIAMQCGANPDDPAAGGCIAVWHLDGLTVSMYVSGPSADVTEQSATSLFDSILPEAIASLTATAPAPPAADDATTATIAAAAVNADASWVSSWYDPSLLDGLTATFIPDGPAHSYAQFIAGALEAEGHTASPNPATPYTLTVESVTMLDAGVADVVACAVDSTVISDASGAVVNDAVSAVRQRYTMVEVDGQWLLWQLARLDMTDGATTCADAPATSVSTPPTTLAVMPG